MMEATQWRWPPSWLEAESETLVEDLFKLRGLVGIVERQLKPPG